MAVDHKRIRELFGKKEESADNSLRAKALQRALGGKAPKTLTPHEWEQWYAENGVPTEHLQPLSKATRLSWWRRIQNRWRAL